MKIISFNIRGLGGRIKKEVRQMVKIQTPDMVCLQESKVEGVDRRLCSMLWVNDNLEWVGE